MELSVTLSGMKKSYYLKQNMKWKKPKTFRFSQQTALFMQLQIESVYVRMYLFKWTMQSFDLLFRSCVINAKYHSHSTAHNTQ